MSKMNEGVAATATVRVLQIHTLFQSSAAGSWNGCTTGLVVPCCQTHGWTLGGPTPETEQEVCGGNCALARISHGLSEQLLRGRLRRQSWARARFGLRKVPQQHYARRESDHRRYFLGICQS